MTVSDELALWAESGAMWLSGRPDGPPLAGPGTPCTTARDLLAALSGLAPQAALPSVSVLAERAAYAGHTRRAPWSCGGAFRILPTRDGHIGLSLARPSDRELVPALVQAEVTDPWTAVTQWAAASSTAQAQKRMRLLGLAGSGVPSQEAPRSDDAAAPYVDGVAITARGPRRHRRRVPLVLDLSTLWAGPLCANLLGLMGARIVTVESVGRVDPTRGSAPDFYDMLHADHERVRLDPARERPLLSAMIADADLVIESARPRGLRHLGIVAEDFVAAGTSWLSITALGRGSAAVGFGDDIAAAAGHFVQDGDALIPVGDALADPLTGLAAAVACATALEDTESRLIDVSMLAVARSAAGPAGAPPPSPSVTCHPDGQWWVSEGDSRMRVRPPQRRMR